MPSVRVIKTPRFDLMCHQRGSDIMTQSSCFFLCSSLHKCFHSKHKLEELRPRKLQRELNTPKSSFFFKKGGKGNHFSVYERLKLDV